MSHQVSLAQALTAIRTVGATNTMILRAQPGIGKSWLLKDLAEALPEYAVAYIDCANLDLGDIAMPVVDREALVTNYAVNARFQLRRDSQRPVIVMLDEVTKPSSESVLNMLLPLILERRLGDLHLPAGSIVFGTGNLDTDGVGDMFPAHAYNRVTVLDVRNPTSEEWVRWGANNDVDPVLLAFAHEYPQIFDRYDNESAKDNPYIFNPDRGNVRSFCSPRSLHHASHIVKQRDVLGEAMLPMLAGTVGAAAASQIEAYVGLMDALPRYGEILAEPTKVKLPGGAGAYFMCAASMASRVKKDELDAVLAYVARWTSFEAKTLFARTLAGNSKKAVFALTSMSFMKLSHEINKFF